MHKRIIAFVLGAAAVLASLLPLFDTFEIFKDFRDPNQSFWPNVLGVLVMGCMATIAIWLGLRFLRFAFSGREATRNGWARPLLLGVAFFFPGFIFSIPIVMLCMWRRWPGDDPNLMLAVAISAGIGVVAAITCGGLLLRQHARRLAQ